MKAALLALVLVATNAFAQSPDWLLVSETGRAQAGAGYDGGDKIDGVGRHSAHRIRHRLERRTGIDQRGTQHVTRQTRGRIDPGV